VGATGCKTVGSAYVGSYPTPATRARPPAPLGHRHRGGVAARTPRTTRFTFFLDEHPRVWRLISGILVRGTSSGDVQKLRARASADGTTRLALLLIELAEQYGHHRPSGGVVIEPPLSQSELASWVDASRETVARALKIWRSRGLVGTARRRITVLDVAGLRAWASDQSPHAQMTRTERGTTLVGLTAQSLRRCSY
jgi:CRP/FNR family cyclic AMP-dependent transcriptional regulator